MPNRKKVLLITYYWPPAGGAGVQRWLKMSKYVAKRHDLTVYIPQHAQYAITDDSLQTEIPDGVKIISHPIREPYALAEKFNPKNKAYQKGQIDDKGEQSFLSKVSLWVRANLFVPDARAWWIMPSYQYLNHYIQNHPQDVIISTGPPHSMHVIGLRLKLKFPALKWLADFRDPWTQIDYFDKLPLRQRALKKHQKLEKEVLKYADEVITVSPSWAKELSAIGQKKVHVIYNGYDQGDFDREATPTQKFSITYVGSLNDDRNPSILWKSLDKLAQDKQFYQDFEVNLVGHISTQVKREIQAYPRLKLKVNFVNYLPHKEAVKVLQESHVLLLLINKTANEKGIIPGKFFEYLAANRKILCLGTKGIDIQWLIEKTNAGVFASRDDENKIQKTLHIWYQKYQKGLLNQIKVRNYGAYSRKEAANKFIQLIDNI